MKTKIFSLLLLSVLFLNCNGQTPKNIQTIPPLDFAAKLKATPNAQLLDVRTPEEFAGEHIDDAANVNWNSDDFAARASRYDKSKPIFVYCKVGGRSAEAAQKLQEMGFSQIYNLQGGMMKWSAAGLAKPDERIIGMCDQEFGELLKTDKKVLVDFYADWCEPCKKMTPFVLKMQKDMADKVTIVRLNADENKTLASQLKVDDLPALMLYQNGKVVWEHKGFVSEEDLKKQLQ
ncbi:MAG TPA: thioredoxin domain-containing protein [Flavobacterium sp.]|nr:thioredoxin domain-containing protein [Flavobacterium sp.]